VNTLTVTSPTLRSNLPAGNAKSWIILEEGIGLSRDYVSLAGSTAVLLPLSPGRSPGASQQLSTVVTMLTMLTVERARTAQAFRGNNLREVLPCALDQPRQSESRIGPADK
jgi:hypothetical protein